MKTKKYAVDCFWTVARSFEFEASSREEAEEKMREMIDSGMVNVWCDHFEATDDVEVKCSGEEGEDGMIEYY